MVETLSSTELKGMLRDAGLRATSARIVVLGCLLEAEAPLSHGEVCGLLEERGYDRATLYRNLSDLTEAGLLTRRDHGDHLWRFEVASAADEHDRTDHPHFVCNECGVVECLPEEAVAVTRAAPKVRKVEVQLRGVCESCD
jgi:Fur family ferric uptake transcriptional regulator